MKWEVFISYRQKDSTEFVKELEKQLTDKLSDWYSVTYDSDFKKGEDIQDNITKAINKCSFLIIISR